MGLDGTWQSQFVSDLAIASAESHSDMAELQAWGDAFMLKMAPPKL